MVFKLEEKIDKIHEKIKYFSREFEYTNMNHMDILQLQVEISEIKNYWIQSRFKDSHRKYLN